MERIVSKELQELRDSGEEIFSISRLDSINQCLYSAYRTYRLHDRGDNNIYALLGSRIHDTLEMITNGEATEEDLLPAMNQELSDLSLFDIDFPSDSIRANWIANMESFCRDYRKPSSEDGSTYVAEEEFIYTTPNLKAPLVGYIDLQRIRPDGSRDLFDFKTSSDFGKEELKKKARQLLVYAMGKEQEGVKVKSASFIMLKYATIKYNGYKTARSKERTPIKKHCERRKIGETLETPITRDLLELGMDEVDISFITEKIKEYNSLDIPGIDTPEYLKVRENYHILPYLVTVDLTQENYDECVQYIEDTITMWKGLGDDVENYPPLEFIEKVEGKKPKDNRFFCHALCGHYKNCDYIHEFDEKQEALREGSEEEDLFG